MKLETGRGCDGERHENVFESFTRAKQQGKCKKCKDHENCLIVYNFLKNRYEEEYIKWQQQLEKEKL